MGMEHSVGELKGLQTQMTDFQKLQDSIHALLAKMEAQLTRLEARGVLMEDDDQEEEDKEDEEVYSSTHSVGPPPGLTSPLERQTAPELVADSVSSPVFNLPPSLSTIGEESPSTSAKFQVDSKVGMRTAVPPFETHTAPLPHTSVATTAGSAGTSTGATTIGIGQLKLEGPARYSGGRRPNVRSWLVDVEKWMRLMRYPTTDWIDIVATQLDGAASSWMEKEL